MARYITSESWYNTLSDEDKAMFDKAWADAQEKVFAECPDPDETYIQLLQDEGMEIVEPDNAAFIELAEPVVKEYNDANWKEGLLDLVNSL